MSLRARALAAGLGLLLGVPSPAAAARLVAGPPTVGDDDAIEVWVAAFDERTLERHRIADLRLALGGHEIAARPEPGTLEIAAAWPAERWPVVLGVVFLREQDLRPGIPLGRAQSEVVLEAVTRSLDGLPRQTPTLFTPFSRGRPVPVKLSRVGAVDGYQLANSPIYPNPADLLGALEVHLPGLLAPERPPMKVLLIVTHGLDISDAQSPALARITERLAQERVFVVLASFPPVREQRRAEAFLERLGRESGALRVQGPLEELPDRMAALGQGPLGFRRVTFPVSGWRRWWGGTVTPTLRLRQAGQAEITLVPVHLPGRGPWVLLTAAGLAGAGFGVRVLRARRRAERRWTNLLYQLQAAVLEELPLEEIARRLRGAHPMVIGRLVNLDLERFVPPRRFAFLRTPEGRERLRGVWAALRESRGRGDQ